MDPRNLYELAMRYAPQHSEAKLAAERISRAPFERVLDLESAVRLLSAEVNELRDRVASLEAVNASREPDSHG